MLKKIEEQINNSAKKYSDKIFYISFFFIFSHITYSGPSWGLRDPQVNWRNHDNRERTLHNPGNICEPWDIFGSH